MLCLAGRADAWTIGGRFGIEVDGIGEEFASSALFDERLDPDEDGLGDLEEDLVVSREAKVMGLLDLRLEHSSSRSRWFSLANTVRIGDSRHRNSFVAEGGVGNESDRLELEGRWDLLGGSDEPAAGSNATLLGSWDRRGLPMGFASRLQLAADWSETDENDLAAIFDYRTLRGQAELRRDLGGSLELRSSGGWRDKTAMRSSVGSYGAGWGELELSGSTWRGDRGDVSLRVESRSYSSDSLGVPSSVEYLCDGRYERRVNRWLRPYSVQRIEREEYEEPYGIFQDHGAWEAEIGTDLFPWEGADPDTAALASSWRIRLGGVYEIFRASGQSDSLTSFDSTFDRFGGVIAIAREGIGALWFDLSVESGRREYRNSAAGGTYVFEGLNLSLASSDYTYLRSTLIAQWSPSPRLRAEAFLQWDAEYHDRSDDDFHLWILNVALTHPF